MAAMGKESPWLNPETLPSLISTTAAAVSYALASYFAGTKAHHYAKPAIKNATFWSTLILGLGISTCTLIEMATDPETVSKAPWISLYPFALPLTVAATGWARRYFHPEPVQQRRITPVYFSKQLLYLTKDQTEKDALLNIGSSLNVQLGVFKIFLAKKAGNLFTTEGFITTFLNAPWEALGKKEIFTFFLILESRLKNPPQQKTKEKAERILITQLLTGLLLAPESSDRIHQLASYFDGSTVKKYLAAAHALAFPAAPSNRWREKTADSIKPTLPIVTATTQKPDAVATIVAMAKPPLSELDALINKINRFLDGLGNIPLSTCYHADSDHPISKTLQKKITELPTIQSASGNLLQNPAVFFVIYETLLHLEKEKSEHTSGVKACQVFFDILYAQLRHSDGKMRIDLSGTQIAARHPIVSTDIETAKTVEALTRKAAEAQAQQKAERAAQQKAERAAQRKASEAQRQKAIEAPAPAATPTEMAKKEPALNPPKTTMARSTVTKPRKPPKKLTETPTQEPAAPAKTLTMSYAAALAGTASLPQKKPPISPTLAPTESASPPTPESGRSSRSSNSSLSVDAAPFTPSSTRPFQAAAMATPAQPRILIADMPPDKAPAFTESVALFIEKLKNAALYQIELASGTGETVDTVSLIKKIPHTVLFMGSRVNMAPADANALKKDWDFHIFLQCKNVEEYININGKIQSIIYQQPRVVPAPPDPTGKRCGWSIITEEGDNLDLTISWSIEKTPDEQAVEMVRGCVISPACEAIDLTNSKKYECVPTLLAEDGSKQWKFTLPLEERVPKHYGYTLAKIMLNHRDCGHYPALEPALLQDMRVFFSKLDSYFDEAITETARLLSIKNYYPKHLAAIEVRNTSSREVINQHMKFFAHQMAGLILSIRPQPWLAVTAPAGIVYPTPAASFVSTLGGHDCTAPSARLPPCHAGAGSSPEYPATGSP